MSRRLRILAGGPGGWAPGHARRWADVALAVRRRRTIAAAFVADGELRADLLERFVRPYLGERQPVPGARRPRRPRRSPAEGRDRVALSRRRLFVGDAG